MKNQSVIGIDIGAPNVRIGRIQDDRVEEEVFITISTDKSQNTIVNEIISGIEQVIDANVAGIGVGVPSIVDVKTGIVYEVSRIPSWKKVPLKSLLEKRFNVPVYVNNDANCFATGVNYFSKGKKYRDVVGLILDEGLGAGVILDNKLQSGSNCGVGEFGKLPFKENDYEYYCSAQFFKNEFNVCFEDVLGLAKNNDREALKVFEKYGYFLGMALKTIIYTLDPQIIVLGGCVANAIKFYKDSMDLQLKSFTFQRTIDNIVIETATDPNLAILGAAALYYDAHYQTDLDSIRQQQKKMESVLEQTEERYYKVFNNISDPIFIFDKKTHKFLDCNSQVVKRVYGYSINELKNMTPMDLHPPDELKRVKENIDVNQPDRPNTYTHVTKSGERMQVEIQSDDMVFDGHRATISVVRNISERIKAEQAAHQRANQSALILKVAERINSALDLDTVLSEIVDGVYESFKYYGVMLLLLDDKKNFVLNSISGGYADVFPSDLTIKFGEGMIGTAAKTKKVQISGDVTEDPNYVKKAEEVTVSELSVPIISGKDVIGVLDMQSAKKNAFDDSDVSAAWTLSSQISTAIKNARLYDQAQKEIEDRRKAEIENELKAAQTALIYEVGQRINSSLDLDTLLSEICSAICDTFDYYGVMLMMVNGKRNKLVLRSIAGGYADVFPADLSVKMGEGMVGTAAKTKSIQISGDVTKDPNYVRKAEEVTKSELSVPIVSGRKVIGVLDMQSDRINAFSQSDSSLAWTIAGQVATGIENANLYYQAQLEIKERKEAEKELLKSRNNLRKAKRETDSIFKNVEEGLFLLNDKLIIASEHSQALASILREKKPGGMNLMDLLNDKLPSGIYENISEYLELMLESGVDEESLSTLNPLSQIEVIFDKGELARYLSFKFRRIMSNKKITGLIATVNDVTEQVQLSQKLEESRSQSKRQMDWLLSILHVEPQLLKEFIDGVNAELKYIDEILRENGHRTKFSSILEKIYRSMHLIKGNASILDLKFFVEKAHSFEEKLSKLKQKSKVTGSDFVPLVLQLGDIRQTVGELNNLIDRISKIHSHFRPKRSYESEVFIRSIQNLINNISSDLDKKINFDHSEFDAGLIPYEYKLTVREIIIQLVRNSIYHGIESRDERKKAKKRQTGGIQIVNVTDDQYVGFKYRDDGRGLQINKLREKARDSGRWSESEIEQWSDAEVLNTIFTTGISTVDRANLIAGRGVGLDIVKDKVDRLYGEIKVDFKKGKYTEFTILFPEFKQVNQSVNETEVAAEAG